jgi:hypothetical protein
LRAARESFEKVKKARNVVAGRALRQQIQSFDWLFVKADATEMTIRVTSMDRRPGGLKQGARADSLSLDLPLGRVVKVSIDGREGKLTDLSASMQVSLRMAADFPEVIQIDATSTRRAPDQVLKAVDVANGTISVTVGEKVTLEGIPVDEAEIKIDDEEDRRLKDLRPGMRVSLDLSVRDGLIVVKRIVARK